MKKKHWNRAFEAFFVATKVHLALCHRKWQIFFMKNGYTKIFFSDPKSAVLTQPKDISGIFSKGHDGIKIVPIVFKYIHHKWALVWIWSRIYFFGIQNKNSWNVRSSYIMWFFGLVCPVFIQFLTHAVLLLSLKCNLLQVSVNPP